MVKKKVDSYDHQGEKRKNNPPVGLVSSATDKLNGRTEYAHNPHIDPFLSWASKKEKDDFEVQNVSLHIHERIDANRIIKSFLKEEEEKQPSLFESDDNQPPLNKAVKFYQHEQDWTNRLIAGDSLMVMNSLLLKEGMAGKVQMVYIDPPYGIKYNSNFQPFVNKRKVGENDDDIPAEPEMIRAFRDIWELDIHSYLTYMRERLYLAKELLHESGSVFVQINDENVHLIRILMDEIFGKQNFIGEISFQTATNQNTKRIQRLFDFIVWYGKDSAKSNIKFKHLYKKQSEYELSNIYTSTDEDGNMYKKAQIKENWDLGTLEKHGRLSADKRYAKRMADDFPFKKYHNVWDDTVISTFSKEKIYAVQTPVKTIERCLLMVTDPGDLVLDPTCGSGTTAYAAEKYGRRWITCDTSRVAVTLAKQRLMTAKFDYYQLANPSEGIKNGFNYNTVPHITLGSIAKNESPKQEILYDQPIKDNAKVRVTGPFTVEAVPCLRIRPFDGNEPKIEGTGQELSRTGETSRQTLYRDRLKSTGIRGKGGTKIEFSAIEPMRATRFLHAKGEVIENDTIKKAYISFGPDFGPLEQRQVEEAMEEVETLKRKVDFIIFAAFHFDPEAAKDIDQMVTAIKGTRILKAQMSVDLLTDDLRRNAREDQSYWLIGQPDVNVRKEKNGKYIVQVSGFDYYNPISGKIDSGNSEHIAMWFLDTNYDERSLFPAQVFFPLKDSQRDWTKLARELNGSIDKKLIEAFIGVESLPFDAGDQNKIAVKIVDDRGIESFVVKPLE